MSSSEHRGSPLPTDAFARQTAPNTSAQNRFSSVSEPLADAHINGEYLKNHPTWHVEFSPWKAANVFSLMQRNRLEPKTICEIGAVLERLCASYKWNLDPATVLCGYDVSPQAIEMAKTRENDRLHFSVEDFGEVDTPYFDLLLMLEVVDHVEDYFLDF